MIVVIKDKKWVYVINKGNLKVDEIYLKKGFKKEKYIK